MTDSPEPDGPFTASEHDPQASMAVSSSTSSGSSQAGVTPAQTKRPAAE